MSFFTLASISFVFLFFYACLGSFISWKLKKADIADVFWGGGFVLVSFLSLIFSNPNTYSLILFGLIFLWATRLSSHIYLRNRHKKEDFRYQELKNHKPFFSFFELLGKVFLLQGFIQWTISLMLLWIFSHAELIQSRFFFSAIGLWSVGFALEVIADWQLSSFMRNKGSESVCQRGLWKYSRHPNFLGEIIQWWSIFLIACFLDQGYFFIFAPLLLSYLIIFVSGIAPIERKMSEKQSYLQYKQSTPCLVGNKVCNGLLYTVFWIYFVYLAPQGSSLSQISIFLVGSLLQIIIFFFMDRKSLMLFPFSMVYSLVLGCLQQIFLVKLGFVKYETSDLIIPIWLVALYPLFGQTFFSSFRFLFSSYTLAFFLGGLGGLLSYLTAKEIPVVEFQGVFPCVAIFISWSLFFTVMTYAVQKLDKLYAYYVNPLMYENRLTVFFDTSCRICNKEKCRLQKRDSKESVIFETIEPKERFNTLGLPFSYNQASHRIHAIDTKKMVYKGIDALSELYARTDLQFLAIFLQAPFCRVMNKCCYKIWAKTRFIWKKRF